MVCVKSQAFEVPLSGSWAKAAATLISSLPGLNGAVFDSCDSTGIPAMRGCSSVVKVKPQTAQVRRLHIWGAFFDGRELATRVVGLEQFMQNMYTYCHTANKKASV